MTERGGDDGEQREDSEVPEDLKRFPRDPLADALIGDDPEPEGGWRRFNEQGERVDKNGNVIPDQPE